MNPIAEGWSANVVSPNSAVPVNGDQGLNAWQVNDVTTLVNVSASYALVVTSEQATSFLTSGWKLSVRVRVVEAPDTLDSAVASWMQLGSRQWLMDFGSEDNGDQTVLAGSTSSTYSSVGAGNVYHLYEMIYDPVDQSADIFVDGVERISGYTGVESQPGNIIGWGSGSSYGIGSGNWNMVAVEIVPEPATLSMLALGGLALVRRRKA